MNDFVISFAQFGREGSDEEEDSICLSKVWTLNRAEARSTSGFYPSSSY